MYIQLSELSPTQFYMRIIQTLIPLPVAWLLSENANGSYNLAPFSYFNAVCSDPPLIMLSIGKKPDGHFKDTRINIEQRTHFMVHIAHRQMAKPLTQSSATLPAGVSEVDRLALKTVSFDGFSMPRLQACRIAYACECYEVREIGGAPQALVLGLVKSLYVDDAVLRKDGKGRIKVAAELVDPLGRLGANEYVTFGEVLHIPRPP